MENQSMEQQIENIGREIFRLVENDTPSIFDKRRWKGELVDLAIKDDTFKEKMFQFVDLLPSLKRDEDISRYIKEYFISDNNRDMPAILRWGLKGITAKNRIFSKTISSILKKNIELLARQFIASFDPSDISEILTDLRREQIVSTVDMLGEAVLSDKESLDYIDRYLNLIDILRETVSFWENEDILDTDSRTNIPKADISIKLSSLYSQFDPADWKGSIERVTSAISPVLKKAEEAFISVTIDMEHHQFKDLTLAVLEEILNRDEFKGVYIGIAIQAYLKSADEDIARVIKISKGKGKRIAVRLVKGAYWDFEKISHRQKGWDIPVFLNKRDTDESYEALTKIILENYEYIRPAFASHNMRSIANAIAIADRLHIPKEGLEFQALYGMAEPIRKAVCAMGYRVRLYIPIGRLIPGMAYLVRRLLENTSNESFLRRSFYEKRGFEELIKLPERVVADHTPLEKGFENEPLLDFAKEENRQRMADAVSSVRETFGRDYPLYIAGEERRKDRFITSINPAFPGEVIGRVSSADRSDAEDALFFASANYKRWKDTPAEVRAGYLYKAADIMRERRFEITSLIVNEVGKNWREADGDICEAIDFLRYYGREMERLGKGERLGTRYPGEINRYIYEPRGVGVVISPWNFPLAIAAGMISAAIVSGNVVIFKPSSLSPVTGSVLVDIFRSAGLPEYVLQFVPGEGREIGDFLVSSPKVDFIAFTGSKEVGLRIVELAAKVHSGQRNIKKLILEMGGKNAIIVDESADIDEAVKGIISSAFGYQGQKCSACSRVIAVEDIYEELLYRLVEAAKSINIGDPADPKNLMGPMIDKAAVDKVKRYVAIGETEGRLLLKSEIDSEGYFIGPVIFAEVANTAQIAQEEIFGPVLSVIKAKDFDEALLKANSTQYGLTGGIYSRSPVNIDKAVRELLAGNIYINRGITGAIVGRQPFGGVLMSGVGSKAGGPDYLQQFLVPKSISENTIRKGISFE